MCDTTEVDESVVKLEIYRYIGEVAKLVRYLLIVCSLRHLYLSSLAFKIKIYSGRRLCLLSEHNIRVNVYLNFGLVQTYRFTDMIQENCEGI